MPCEPRRRSSYGLNLTPLIDVVFLLLVFFLLTAHFVRDEALDIELPTAQSVSPADAEGVLQVVLGRDGAIRVRDRRVAPDQLEAVIRAELPPEGPRMVQLRGDQEAKLGLTVLVIDAARKAGARSLDILAERR